MLFTGEYEHTIDAKQRLAIPADVRSRLDPEQFGEAFYLVPGPNGCLWLWPERTFERMAGSTERSLLPAEELMEFEELLFSQATRLEMDKTGRIRLPERMMRRFGLEGTVTILGVKDHLELRDAERWRVQLEQKYDKQPEIMWRARQALEERRGGGKDAP
ncbi:MAG: division/cell wall cluster transcriptional repressor MraZ [Planctomycetota bacterium]